MPLDANDISQKNVNKCSISPCFGNESWFSVYKVIHSKEAIFNFLFLRIDIPSVKVQKITFCFAKLSYHGHFSKWHILSKLNFKLAYRYLQITNFEDSDFNRYFILMDFHLVCNTICI